MSNWVVLTDDTRSYPTTWEQVLFTDGIDTYLGCFTIGRGWVVPDRNGTEHISNVTAWQPRPAPYLGGKQQ